MWYPFIIKSHYNINMPLNMKIFLDIILFSKGPQDLPSSNNLYNIAILANLLIALISFTPDSQITLNLLNAVIFIVITIIFIKAALNIRDGVRESQIYSARYIQVCTTVMGIHVAFVLLQGLLIILFVDSSEFSKDNISPDVAIIFILVSLYAWFVNGHIFKNALDTSMMFGLGVSILHNISILFFTLIALQILI